MHNDVVPSFGVLTKYMREKYGNMKEAFKLFMLILQYGICSYFIFILYRFDRRILTKTG